MILSTDLPRIPLAVIIGCGDIGMGSARRLGQDHPLLIIDRDDHRLRRAVEALTAQDIAASGLVCDITQSGDLNALGRLLAGSAGVKVLAHVAAVGPSIGDWRKLMTVNLIGPHLTACAVRPYMGPGSAAILVSSGGAYMVKPAPALDRILDDPLADNFFDGLIGAHGGEPDLETAYFYSKYGLNRLARRLAVAWGPDGVRALSISPGAIDTRMARRDGALSAGRAELVKAIPLGREGTIDEVAAMIAFLASDAASFVTGVDLRIDGGSSAARALQRDG